MSLDRGLFQLTLPYTWRGWIGWVIGVLLVPVSYTHLTLPTKA